MHNVDKAIVVIGGLMLVGTILVAFELIRTFMVA